jgi:epsilon-lactone hydrolase
MSIRASLISFLMRRTVKAQLENIGDDVPAFRERMSSANGLMPKLPKDAIVEKIDVEGVDCEWVSVDGADPKRILMYLHGGGYVFGGFDSHRDLAYRLSSASGMKVLLVDYRLAPENQFPAAVEDATACYRWLLSQGYEPEQIAIGGDSAGGGLTLSTLVNLKNLGVSQPAGAILLSPWLDLSASGNSVATNARADAMLSPVSLDSFARLYLGDLDRKAPLASPLFADLSGLPAILVHVGSTEILLSDAQRLVENIQGVGGEIALDVWPKMPHVFQLFSGRIPEGKAAIEQLGQFIQNRTATS